MFVEPASAQTIQELSTKHGFVVESVVKLTARYVIITSTLHIIFFLNKCIINEYS